MTKENVPASEAPTPLSDQQIYAAIAPHLSPRTVIKGLYILMQGIFEEEQDPQIQAYLANLKRYAADRSCRFASYNAKDGKRHYISDTYQNWLLELALLESDRAHKRLTDENSFTDRARNILHVAAEGVVRMNALPPRYGRGIGETLIAVIASTLAFGGVSLAGILLADTAIAVTFGIVWGVTVLPFLPFLIMAGIARWKYSQWYHKLQALEESSEIGARIKTARSDFEIQTKELAFISRAQLLERDGDNTTKFTEQDIISVLKTSSNIKLVKAMLPHMDARASLSNYNCNPLREAYRQQLQSNTSDSSWGIGYECDRLVQKLCKVGWQFRSIDFSQCSSDTPLKVAIETNNAAAVACLLSHSVFTQRLQDHPRYVDKLSELARNNSEIQDLLRPFLQKTYREETKVTSSSPSKRLYAMSSEVKEDGSVSDKASSPPWQQALRYRIEQQIDILKPDAPKSNAEDKAHQAAQREGDPLAVATH